jgi:hypothetical protein
MAEHGGGGGSNTGFLLAFFACIAVAWFFAQVQKQAQTASNVAPTAMETGVAYEHAPEPEHAETHTPRRQAPEAEHGVTYYLDEDGTILDVVYF